MYTMIIILPAAISDTDKQKWANAKRLLVSTVGSTNIVDAPSSGTKAIPSIVVDYKISMNKRDRIQESIGEDFALIFIDIDELPSSSFEDAYCLKLSKIEGDSIL